jgi:hypothetical protein
MSQSNVGYPSLYEGGDQRHYSKEEVREENRTHPNVNTEGYRKFFKPWSFLSNWF